MEEKIKREEIKEIEETVKLTNINLQEFLNEKFIKSLESLKDEKIFPIAIVLIESNKKQPFPLIISHENKGEIENKIVHISSPDPMLLEKIKNIIKEM